MSVITSRHKNAKVTVKKSTSPRCACPTQGSYLGECHPETGGHRKSPLSHVQTTMYLKAAVQWFGMFNVLENDNKGIVVYLDIHIIISIIS